MKLAVISDTHFVDDRAAAVGNRQAGLADILALRLVHRLNRYIKPDLTVVLGDVVNDGDGVGADAALSRMAAVLGRLAMPWLVIPGNHDGGSGLFYHHFPLPSDVVDVAGVRFLLFADPEEPGYNARRPAAALQRMEAARADGWRGPVVTLQHVPVFPEGAHSCPYHYVNSGDIIEAMRQQGITCALSGHYHPGIDLLRDGGMAFVVAPALCEAPFQYLLIDIDGETVQVERQSLAMPESLGLVDAHVHTHLAYCNENMDIGLASRLADAFGLSSLRFAEHSGHLYFDRHEYSSGCCLEGISAARQENDRMAEYLNALDAHAVPRHCRGIEIDCDARGKPVIREPDLVALPFRLGAVHGLPSLADAACGEETVRGEFLCLLERFLGSEPNVLAHPFRVFRRAGRTIPQGLVEPVVQMLKAAGVAAEINFHTNEPPVELVEACLRDGVRLSFGSDAHNLYEVGEFFPHLSLLKQAGFDGGPADILLQT